MIYCGLKENGAEVILVAMHWGIEYDSMPNVYQKDIAEFLASQGVNVVIGTHPHVIQPITWIGDTLVIYSLGNFLSAQKKDGDYNKLVGLMTNYNIVKTKKGKNLKISIENLNNELIFTYSQNFKNFKVIPFSKINDTQLPNYKTVYEKYKNIVQAYNQDIQVVPINE